MDADTKENAQDKSKQKGHMGKSTKNARVLRLAQNNKRAAINAGEEPQKKETYEENRSQAPGVLPRDQGKNLRGKETGFGPEVRDGKGDAQRKA